MEPIDDSGVFLGIDVDSASTLLELVSLVVVKQVFRM